MNDWVLWVLVAVSALPISIWAYAAAGDDGVLAAGTVVLSLLLGAVGRASVIVVLMLKGRFRYADV